MSAVIKARTISGTPDSRIQLAAGAIARPLAFGSDWTKIRVGMRFGLTDTGGNLPGNPKLFMGVCSGTTNIFGDASVDNACGAITGVATLTRGTDGTRVWYGTNNYIYPVKQVGVTRTVGATPIVGAPGTYFGASPTLPWRDVQFVDIEKGSPNYSFWVFWLSNLNDWSSDNFLCEMDQQTPAFFSHFYSGPQTLAVDETAGVFDTLCIYWDQATSPAEISDIAVARIA